MPSREHVFRDFGVIDGTFCSNLSWMRSRVKDLVERVNDKILPAQL